MALSVSTRVLHLLNTLRAIHEMGPRGRRDMVCNALELACVLVFWCGIVSNGHARGEAVIVMALWTTAVTGELLFIVLEPVHVAYRRLRALGAITQELERVPFDIGYVEKRWDRLLMIALAMLPSFTASYIQADYGTTFAAGFVVTACTLAYIIKVFYFDLVDDHKCDVAPAPAASLLPPA